MLSDSGYYILDAHLSVEKDDRDTTEREKMERLKEHLHSLGPVAQPPKFRRTQSRYTKFATRTERV